MNGFALSARARIRCEPRARVGNLLGRLSNLAYARDISKRQKVPNQTNARRMHLEDTKTSASAPVRLTGHCGHRRRPHERKLQRRTRVPVDGDLRPPKLILHTHICLSQHCPVFHWNNIVNIIFGCLRVSDAPHYCDVILYAQAQ